MQRAEIQKKGLRLIKQIDRILTEEGIWFSLAYGSVLGAYREHGFISWDGDIDIMIKLPDQDKVTSVLREKLSKEEYILISHDKDEISGFDEIDIKGISSVEMHVDIYPLIGGNDNINDAYKHMKHCRRIHKLLNCKYCELNRLTSKYKIPIVLGIRAFEFLIPDSVIRRYMDGINEKYSFDKSRYFFPIGNDGKITEIMTADMLFSIKRIAFEDTFLPVPKDTVNYLKRLYGDHFMTPIKY